MSMPGTIFLFGATGYTGELTAAALVAQGAEPVLVGRSAERLRALASATGGLRTEIADVDRPESLRSLLKRGDVLITTVGPQARMPVLGSCSRSHPRNSERPCKLADPSGLRRCDFPLRSRSSGSVRRAWRGWS
jgi:short subunit dehydrogenase-like uncharacterized protein